MYNSTLCYIEDPQGNYLMLHRVKKKNDLNHDKWVGVGGKFEDGESPEECVLRETLEEIRVRQVDAEKNYRVRVAVVGSEIDDPNLIRLIESCGALVVADRYCYGAMESRQPIEIKEGETPLRAIARHYLLTSQCTRFMEQNEMRHRKQVIADMAKEYKADGIIIASNKFCEYWSYERVIDTVVLQRDFGYPVCSIEKEYINSASGQLRTRFQAFIESVEIKKIQGGNN